MSKGVLKKKERRNFCTYEISFSPLNQKKKMKKYFKTFSFEGQTGPF
jgi:hypothetical protein